MHVRVQKWGNSLAVRIPKPLAEDAGVGVMLADQVKSLDWRIRKAEFICKLPRATTSEVLDKLGTLLLDS